LNKGCRVDSSCNKVKANDVCAQDLSNAQGVDAPVAGSLRVQQPYGDKDKVTRSQTEVVNGVRNSNLTRVNKWRIEAKGKPRDNKPGVIARGRMTKLESNANC